MTGVSGSSVRGLLAGLLLGTGIALAGSLAEHCRAARESRGVVRVLQFGDSHLAARESSQPVGDAFRERFGDGGPGLGLPWITGRPGLTAQASKGWRRIRRPGSDGRIGLAAGFMETWRAGESAWFSGGFERFRLCLLTDPQGGRVAVRVDGRPAGEQELQGPANQVAVFSQAVAPGAHRVELRVVRDGLVRILGVGAERAAGAVYSPLAFNGARAAWLLNLPEPLFRTQVQAAAPDLVILAFGTNEANARDFNPDNYRQELDALLGRFQRAAPDAALVLVGPPDARLRLGSGATLARVIHLQRASAGRFGAAFLDRQALMGGPGAMEAWFRQGLARSDRVHLNAQGYPRLAGLMLRELFGGSAGEPARKAAAPLPAASGGSRPPAEAARPLYTYRRAEGGVFITDDPDKVRTLPGEWVPVRSE